MALVYFLLPFDITQLNFTQQGPGAYETNFYDD